jgi:hypothetical protein
MRNLYGFEAHFIDPQDPTVDRQDDDDGKMKVALKPVFIYPSHGGCIKALDLSGKFLASGSTDEVIKYVFLFLLISFFSFFESTLK